MEEELKAEYRPNGAFEKAVKYRVFSTEKVSSNFIGNYMYMYSKGPVDYFKHIFTRKYISIDYSQGSAVVEHSK